MATDLQALVVDDSRAQRSIMRRLLTANGFTVVEAGNGEEGLEALRSGLTPAVVLLDWNMPVMDGQTFLRTVRSDRAHDRLPIVVVTSEASFDVVSRALAAGADEYVMKPCDGEALIDKLAMAGVVPATAGAS